MRDVYDVSRDYLPDVCSTYRRNRKMDQERLNHNTAQNQTNSCPPSASTGIHPIIKNNTKRNQETESESIDTGIAAVDNLQDTGKVTGFMIY